MFVCVDSEQLFEGLTATDYTRVRGFIIQCVLATDLSKGQEYLLNFKTRILQNSNTMQPESVRSSLPDSNDSNGDSDVVGELSTHRRCGGLIAPYARQLDSEQLVIISGMVLKCCDVSHAARPNALHRKWSNLITEEFYAQVCTCATHVLNRHFAHYFTVGCTSMRP